MLSKFEIFKKEYCFTKEDILESFSDYIKYNLAENTVEQSNKNYDKKMLELCYRFKDALSRAHLPKLNDDWWYYDFDLKNDGIELNLYYCNELELDEDGELSSATATQEFTLLNIKCDYLSVGEFADLHKVSNTTVRQWIRRGKLRTVKKVGRDWLIPSVAEKPARGFKTVSYHWRLLPPKITEQFPYLKHHNCIYIFQNKNDKTKFDCILGYPSSGIREKFILTAIEREKLELTLIGNDLIEVNE